MADGGSNEDDLRKAFEAAAMEYLGRANAEIWAAAAVKLRLAHDEHEELVRSYDRDREARIAAKMQDLRDKQVQQRLEHPAPSWVVARSSNIEQEAEKLVRLEHEADVARIRETGRRELTRFVDLAMEGHRVRPPVQDDFERASEGGDGPPDPGPKRSRD